MQKVQEWIAEILMCAPDALPPEHTPLQEIEGWDSLKHVSLVVGLERKLSTKLTAEQIRGIVTVGDVAGVLRQKVPMHDRLVLVTGAAGEIGGSLVNEFLKDNWIVCGLDQRCPPEVREPRWFFSECDLANPADAESKIGAFQEQWGAFDAVINCAGLIANSPLISFVEGQLRHHDFGLWDRVLSSCLSTAFYVTACTALKMVESGKRGVIVNISSICGRGNPGQAAYSAAKAGLNGLTAALAKEMGRFGIRVVAVAPGYIETTSMRTHVPEPKVKEITSSVPLKRLGKIEEVVSAVKFVIANEYINGTVLELDGGQVL